MQISVKTSTEILLLVAALIEYFLIGSAPYMALIRSLRREYFIFVTLLIWINVVTEQFLYGNELLGPK